MAIANQGTPKGVGQGFQGLRVIGNHRVFVIAAEGDRLRYVALWGGVAFPEDEAQIFAWLVSKAPEAPQDLWRCVAHYLATREE